MLLSFIITAATYDIIPVSPRMKIITKTTMTAPTTFFILRSLKLKDFQIKITKEVHRFRNEGAVSEARQTTFNG